MTNFHHLFSPLTVNGLELKNRILMPAFHMKYADHGYATDRLKEFYYERAKGGAAMILVGGMRIDDLGGDIGLDSLSDDSFIEGYQELVKGIHQRGAKVGAQLYHAGRYMRSSSMPDHLPGLSASSTFSGFSRETSREMSVEDIRLTQYKWAEAAVRAKKAGFDAVEIIACTGYLICQFLSEITNKRTDEYGGSLENRCRFGQEVVQAVRRAVGPDYPVFMRITGNDFMPGGAGFTETVAFAKAVEEAGVDLLNVTGGWHETQIPQITGDVPPGTYTYLAHQIKQAVKIPVSASNRINDPYVAEEVLALGKSDMVSMARALLADPQWPNKVREGRLCEIRKCMGCNQGCLANSFFDKPGECLVNGKAGREYLFRDKPAPEKVKKILVVGGGPGGAEAAVNLAQRGHQVTLWEKSDRIGGQLPLVAAPSGKRDFMELIGYYENMLAKSGVEVVCNKEADASEAAAGGFDVVITATGIIPKTMPLPNDDGSVPVYTAHQILAKEVIPGKNVVIIGGGTVGCETAHVLAEAGTLTPEQYHFLCIHHAENREFLDDLMNHSLRNISIVEILPKIGKGFDPGTAWPLLQGLDRMGVKKYPNTKVLSVKDKVVTVERTAKDGAVSVIEIPCDIIILAVGAVPNDKLYRELEGKVPELYNLGDSSGIGKVLTAVRDAVDLAYSI